jgi:ornithine cyclodeaminase/alanine dehydrogenase-like protein (mu-crystallin family)
MPVRILTQAEVTSLLPMAGCVEVMAEALRTLAEGGALLPLRTVLRLPGDRGFFGVMPGHLERPAALGLKAIGVFPGNEGGPLDSHQGVVMLFDPETGAPAAIMDASSITAIRTAAVSGVATRALARPDAGDLAILGSGVQARSHLEAMAAVRPLRRVRVWSRSAANGAAFAEWAARRFGPSVELASSARDAVAGADLVCTTTGSRQPVLEGSWLAEGVHINAVGSSLATARELDSAAVARSRLYVDRRESAEHEAGDYLIPLREGAITAAHIVAELGEVLVGARPGRMEPGDLTLFKSLGLAIEDLAAARYVLDRAEAGGIGELLELGGIRH